MTNILSKSPTAHAHCVHMIMHNVMHANLYGKVEAIRTKKDTNNLTQLIRTNVTAIPKRILKRDR